MNRQDYRKFVKNKMSTLSHLPWIFNGVLGLVGEFLEFREETDRDKIISELGDVIFYLEACYIDLGITSEIIGEIDSQDMVCAKLCNALKKMYFHNGYDKYKEELIYYLYQMEDIILSYIYFYKLSIEEVRDYNVQKLNKRHGGEGFNPNY